MKKLISLILCGLLLISFAACGGEDTVGEAVAEAGETADDAVTEAVENASDAAEEVAEEAEAEIAQVDETVEEVVEEVVETETKKRDSYDEIMFYEDTGDHSPISLLTEGSSFGIHVKFPEGFLEDIAISCPSWSDNVGNLTFKVFTWNTDYETTVAGEAVVSQTFENYTDNDSLMMELYTDDSRGIPAGEYLIWLGDGVDEGGSGVGFWAKGYPVDADYVVEMYQNGAVVDSIGPEGYADIVIPAE